MEQIHILGIHYGGHDASAALMIDGKLVACCEEERYSKQKHTREFPINAINDCLNKGNISIEDVTEISLTYEPDILQQSRIGNKRRSLPNKTHYESLMKEKLGFNGKVSFNLHHLCHVASTYYPSGFENALIISNDGIGEIDCSLMASGKNGEISILHEGNQWPNSIGLFYSAITAYLGWRTAYDEGILMGLAPYGDDTNIIPGTNRTYKEIFQEMIFPVDDFEYEMNPYWLVYHRKRDTWVTEQFNKIFGPHKNWEEPITQHHKDIACAAQRQLERIILKQLEIAREKFGFDKLCISGGVGLNCSLNGKIEQSKIFDEIFVQPASGDNGTAIGACYLAYKNYKKDLKPIKNHNFYLGSSFTDQQIESELIKHRVSYYKSNNVFVETAEYLADKKIIGWFQGCAEAGPRALGNRSILVIPVDGMKDYLNRQVKFREEFRPFAPAVLYEHTSEYFDLKQESPHMLMACQVKEEVKDKIPAVVHVDNSARVQTVKESNNLRFRKLLENVNEITNCPVLLNTSFNVKGQPIVNDPSDAIKCFLDTNIDVLVIGDYIVEK
jgi:carbamoyltransferase